MGGAKPLLDPTPFNMSNPKMTTIPVKWRKFWLCLRVCTCSRALPMVTTVTHCKRPSLLLLLLLLLLLMMTHIVSAVSPHITAFALYAYVWRMRRGLDLFLDAKKTSPNLSQIFSAQNSLKLHNYS